MPSGAVVSTLHGRRSECEALDRLVASARAGDSRALVLRGEAGVGKTALLDYVAERATECRVARVAGVESELEIAFAGLQQLCGPMLDRLDRLPGPQAGALATAFGLRDGDPPERIVVGLAVLGLVSDAAEDQPIVCLVDDAQWLDRVSAETLAFVARRLAAERVALLFAVREPSGERELAGLEELSVRRLSDGDARALLDTVLTGPVDERVRDRIVAETRGNPLALLELPRGLTPEELAGGFGLPETGSLAGRIEEGFVRRLEPLPPDSRRLLLAAAAEPVGDATLLWRAAGRLGVGASAAEPAEAAGLIEFGARVRFRHPLVRSAAYRSASPQERHDVHRALADATDAEVDPDRRAWHRAHATAAPDEDVAAELERSAARAQARGGLAAAAAFLEHAAALTPQPARRARRLLAAARAKRDAGALEAALDLLAAADAGPPDELRAADAEHLRGQIALDQRRGRDATRLLRAAAVRLEPLDAALARETHLEAVAAAMWATGVDGPSDVAETAEAARAAPPAPDPPRPVDVVLDALALRLTAGYAAAAPAMTEALATIRGLELGPDDVAHWLWLAGNRVGGLIASDVWDDEARQELAELQVRRAREAGALVQLQFALNHLALAHLLAGDVRAAGRAVEEDRLIGEATGNPPVGYVTMSLAAFRGPEREAAQLIDTTAGAAAARGQGRLVSLSAFARAVLGNGLGRHDVALGALRNALDRDVLGHGSLVAAELAEAASRTGETALLARTADWMAERARVTPTEWALGIDARVRALRGEGDVDGLYRASIEHLGRTLSRGEAARGRLLYGEWLRREGRRVDARAQLRPAHEMLSALGLEAFAERARRELRATGETVRKRSVETADELTPQEAHIARLARDGFSNPEIGTRLFLSPRTVEWHLKKVFTKLAIGSRKELRDALPA
ncbi:MAG TPA: AAA family ATPase [Solirubrobacteraceae bacterium]|nr:AAA family ATPase [Solirubrobacteraceae bacterium]